MKVSQQLIQCDQENLISANGCLLRNQDTIHFKATMVIFKISGQRTLEISKIFKNNLGFKITNFTNFIQFMPQKE